MLRWLIVCWFCVLFVPLQAQDVITRTNGDMVHCTVIGVTAKAVKYKKTGPENQKVYSIDLEYVDEVRKAGKIIFPDSTRQRKERFSFEEQSPNFFAFNLGAGLPIGLFSETEGSGPGYALPGFSWQLEGAYFFKPFLGLGTKMGAFNNGTDDMAWQSQLRRLNPGVDLTLSAEGWSTRYFLVGPYYSMISGRVILDLSPSIGVVNALDPSFDLSYDENGALIRQTSEPTGTSAFGFGLGAKLRVGLSPKVGLRAGMDYITAQPQISTVVSQTRNGQFDRRGTLSYQQAIAVVNVTCGLVFHFSE